jgi:AraC-like DNA-binding protein
MFFRGSNHRPAFATTVGHHSHARCTVLAAWAAQVFGPPIYELNDLAIDLRDYSQKLRLEFERIRNFPSLALSLQALDALKAGVATRNRVDDERLSCAVRVIERSGGLMNIDRVARRVGWGARQLQRRFRDEVGISPKYFARIQRFQGVLHAMNNPKLNWVSVANRYGYFDQAHLIRDFRQFSGKPPTALLDQELDFTRRFIGRG